MQTADISAEKKDFCRAERMIIKGIQTHPTDRSNYTRGDYHEN